MVCEETEVDVMEPLEEPPGGDVDIAEIKKRYGKKICMKGNINTFEFMLRATPEQVEQKARQPSEMGGTFVLIKSDIGRETVLREQPSHLQRIPSRAVR